MGDAAASGELDRSTRVGAVTDVLLRAIAGATLAWLADGWERERFALEMALSVRLVIGSLAADEVQDSLRRECAGLQDRIAELDAADAVSRAGDAPSRAGRPLRGSRG